HRSERCPRGWVRKPCCSTLLRARGRLLIWVFQQPAGEELHILSLLFQPLHFGVVSRGRGLLRQDGGRGDQRKQWRLRRLFQLAAGERVAMDALILDGIELIVIPDSDRVVLRAEGAARVVAMLLRRRDLAIETTEEIDEFGIAVDMGLWIVP